MITVTGARGSVGSRLVTHLREHGHDVRAVIGPGETPPWAAEDGLQIVEASFSDASAIQRAADGRSPGSAEPSGGGARCRRRLPSQPRVCA